MDENIYYLSIQSTSLAHYMSKALILPSRFYKNRPIDIQDTLNDYLILSKEKFINKSNCSIELILTNKEIEFIENKKDIFLYPKPIPTSRIKKIYFIDEIQKLKTIDSITSGTAYVPENLVSVIVEKNYICNINEIIKNKNFKYSNQLEADIKTYNQILGGVAFVRYTTEGEYSKNYFSILSHFNSYIINDYIEKKNIFKGYDGAFTYIGKVWDKLSPLIYKNISEDDVERYAKEENISIEKSNGIFKYELLDENSIKSLTYKLAILSIYGENSTKRKAISDLIYACKSGKIPKDKIEGISLIFGINNSYSSFDNHYDKKIVKFKMDSLLDYYTIESIFQYTINNKKENTQFKYIDKIFSTEKINSSVTKNILLDFDKIKQDLLQYFQKNTFIKSPKELLGYIFDNFENIINKEIENKNIHINNLTNELEENKNTYKEQIRILEEQLEELRGSKTITKTKQKTVKELKQEAKERGLRNYSKMKKNELLKVLTE